MINYILLQILVVFSESFGSPPTRHDNDDPIAADYLEFQQVEPFGRRLIKDLSDATDCVSTMIFVKVSKNIPKNREKLIRFRKNIKKM